MTEKNKSDVSFRDRISTVDESGKRKWIYPRKPKGRFHRARLIVSWFLLAIFFAGPFITWNDRPFFLFNVLGRRFVIFGVAFWPQDFHLFVLATLAAIIFILLFTVIYGRLFCGWICPQSVFMELVFRKIEYLIEGDAGKQRTLKKKPWNAEKIYKKTLKQAIFFTISFLVANTFMAYLIGAEQFYHHVTGSPTQASGAFIAIVLFSGFFYFIFAWFREQACTLVCPYGRLQGVLLDRDSIMVSYDFNRGEPRTKVSAIKEGAAYGDCIACNLCVQVCPTGIDIRNGQQLECINCTACMDACDSVMQKIKRLMGLIRYASFTTISEGIKLKPTIRMAGYSAVLILMIGLIGFLFFGRSDIETTVLRTPGVMYQKTDDGRIRNLYSIKVINKTYENLPLRFEVLDPEGGEIKLVGGELELEQNDVLESAFFILLPKETLSKVKSRIQIGIYSGDELLETVETNFMGPAL
ncbi:cytochrome c oxidase accessory protein CcoG [Calditrichota bacterium]